MNPAYDPYNPMDPRPSPGSGGVAGAIAAGGGDVPNQYDNRVATHDTPSLQFARSGQSIENLGPQSLAGTQFDASQQLAQRPVPTGGQPMLDSQGQPRLNSRGRPITGWTNPNHQGAIGYDWNRYAQGGNLGTSRTSDRTPTGNLATYPGGFNAAEYPWMSDTSVNWGGGPFGYLPIGYQAQDYRYYQNNMQNLAPWEQKYFNDTWTQNYDKDQPGFINTQRTSRYPDYNPGG